MSLIADSDELWTCRDCGAPIARETVHRICQQLSAVPTEPESTVDDAGHHAFEVIFPGACAACGGGRVVSRLGEVGPLRFPPA